ncbi:carbohydrate sulfotransferase 11-like isoform X2 [Homarus americanus]|uniref:carbohydrate sulfotransferase 11-like isoform X2 n=1 Tax=Homarus americanus TaxID=6706 RepID=UPI001C4904A9|nr:carbohydrate sulfotransferase 11-like isoform X2 [Homarus americanus]
MMCRLRAVVWALVGLTLFTCIASVRWFILSATLADKMPLSSNIPASEETLSLSHVTLEMKHRKKAVERACSVDVWPNTFDNGLPSVGDPITEELVTNPKMLNNLIVDDKNHILYCYVPKPQDIRYRLHTYTKFIFVRHPIERVLSAFRNKFEKNYTSSAYFKKRFGVKIIKKYRKGIDPADIPASGHGVKFSEFVSYLIDTKTDQLNEHWAPVSTMCYPCSVRYDYVGKYETLAEDSEYILREVGAPPSIQFPEVIPSKTTAYVDPYFDTLSKNQQQDLIRIYEDDFRVFDYHFRNLI